MDSPGRARGPLIAAAACATAGVGAGLWWVAEPFVTTGGLVHSPALSLGVAVALLGLVPLAVVTLTPRAGAAPSDRTRAVAAAAITVGVALVGLAVLEASPSHFFALRWMATSWRAAVTGVMDLAPAVVGTLGLALGLGSVGVLARRRWLVVLGGGLMALAATVMCLGLTAGMVVDAVHARRSDLGLLGHALDLHRVLGALVAAAAAGTGAVTTSRLPGRLGAWVPARVTALDAPARTRRARRLRLLTLVGVGAIALVLGGRVVLHERPHVTIAEQVPDAALAACLAHALGTSPQGTVSDADLAAVLTLVCPGDLSQDWAPGWTSTAPDDTCPPAAGSGRPCIHDLTGIDLLPNLVHVELPSHAIGDLAPLAALHHLGTLTLTHNQVRDLAPLAALPLQDLGLSDNDLVDLTPLGGVVTLRYLGLEMNPLVDVAPLAGATELTELSISDTGVLNLGPLSALRSLTRLHAARTDVVDPSPLGELPALTMLDLRGAFVTDASRFVGFPVLDELWLGENPLADVRPLLALPALAGVDLEGLDPASPGIAELQAAGVYVGF